jgi:hypothetical protein
MHIPEIVQAVRNVGMVSPGGSPIATLTGPVDLPIGVVEVSK